MDSRFAGGVVRRAQWLVAFLCSSAAARAQEPEPPPLAAPLSPPSNPPAAPTTPPSSAQEAPPVPAPVAPLPPPAAEQTPAPPVAAVKPPLAWAGTTFAWDNQFSVKILNVGPDHLGSADQESFVTAFSLAPNYFVLWRPRHQLSASTRVTLLSELMASRTTAVDNSFHLADIPLGLDYAATLFSHGHGKSIGGLRTMTDPTLLGEGDFRTWALVSTHVLFPTSPESRDAGVDLATSIGVGIRQQIKLLGGDSPWLSYLLVTASERWTHAFASPSPYNENPYSQRPDLSPHYVAIPNTFSHSLSFTLPIYRALHLDSTFKLRTQIPSSVGEPVDDCVVVATGCVPLDPAAPTKLRWSTLFSVGLSYEIIPELGVALGYFNDALQIGDNGLKRSIFYSPNARFYTNVTFSFDRLYQHLFPPKPASAEPMR